VAAKRVCVAATPLESKLKEYTESYPGFPIGPGGPVLDRGFTCVYDAPEDFLIRF